MLITHICWCYSDNYLGLWCKWYARWTENPEVVVRLHEAPQVYINSLQSYPRGVKQGWKDFTLKSMMLVGQDFCNVNWVSSSVVEQMTV